MTALLAAAVVAQTARAENVAFVNQGHLLDENDAAVTGAHKLPTFIAHLKAQPDAGPLHKFIKPCEELLASWVKPFLNLEAAELKKAMAQTALATSRASWIDAYVALHGGLENAFPSKRAFVEAFFAKFRKAANSKDEAEDETEAPAPPP